MNVTEASNTFITFLKEQNRSPATVTAYSKDIEQLFAFITNDKHINDIRNITTEDLDEYIEKLKNDTQMGYTLKTISRKINSMKSLFKFLYSEKKIKSDPAQAVKHPRYIISPPRILSKLEYRALRDVARYNPRLFSIVELLLQTGIRIGELTRLTISDINLSRNKKILTIKSFASNPQREIELNDPAVFALKKYLEIRPEPKQHVDALFLTKTGNQLLVRNVRTSITRAFEKAGIDNATVNDIRNTFIIHQLKNGMPLERIAQIVGHKRLTSTKKYERLVDNKPKRKINKIIPL
jgi:site-specific recombinase XerD